MKEAIKIVAARTAEKEESLKKRHLPSEFLLPENERSVNIKKTASLVNSIKTSFPPDIPQRLAQISLKSALNDIRNAFFLSYTKNPKTLATCLKLIEHYHPGFTDSLLKELNHVLVDGSTLEATSLIELLSYLVIEGVSPNCSMLEKTGAYLLKTLNATHSMNVESNEFVCFDFEKIFKKCEKFISSSCILIDDPPINKIRMDIYESLTNLEQKVKNALDKNIDLQHKMRVKYADEGTKIIASIDFESKLLDEIKLQTSKIATYLEITDHNDGDSASDENAPTLLVLGDDTFYTLSDLSKIKPSNTSATLLNNYGSLSDGKLSQLIVDLSVNREDRLKFFALSDNVIVSVPVYVKIVANLNDSQKANFIKRLSEKITNRFYLRTSNIKYAKCLVTIWAELFKWKLVSDRDAVMILVNIYRMEASTNKIALLQAYIASAGRVLYFTPSTHISTETIFDKLLEKNGDALTSVHDLIHKSVLRPVSTSEIDIEVSLLKMKLNMLTVDNAKDFAKNLMCLSWNGRHSKKTVGGEILEPSNTVGGELCSTLFSFSFYQNTLALAVLLDSLRKIGFSAEYIEYRIVSAIFDQDEIVSAKQALKVASGYNRVFYANLVSEVVKCTDFSFVKYLSLVSDVPVHRIDWNNVKEVMETYRPIKIFSPYDRRFYKTLCENAEAAGFVLPEIQVGQVFEEVKTPTGSSMKSLASHISDAMIKSSELSSTSVVESKSNYISESPSMPNTPKFITSSGKVIPISPDSALAGSIAKLAKNE